MPHSSPQARIGLAWDLTALMHAITTSVSSNIQIPYCVLKTAFPCSHSPTL